MQPTLILICLFFGLAFAGDIGADLVVPPEDRGGIFVAVSEIAVEKKASDNEERFLKQGTEVEDDRVCFIWAIYGVMESIIYC